jgi:hypothetical protein
MHFYHSLPKPAWKRLETALTIRVGAVVNGRRGTRGALVQIQFDEKVEDYLLNVGSIKTGLKAARALGFKPVDAGVWTR